MPEFDFAVLGAGAIGSIIGAHLARAGHGVVMLARGERAAHIERSGLTIRGLAELTTPVKTLTDPQELKSAGTLIVATKTPGTAASLEPLRSAQFDVTLSIQNGPLKNELLAAAFGAERVLGALADTSGELLPGGEVLFTRNVSLYVGELGGTDSARVHYLVHTLESSGLRATATSEIQTLEWSKFCGWVGFMAVSVTTRALTWQCLSDPDSALLVARLVREMGTLARALGIPLSDRAVLPAASLCAAAESEAVEMILKLGEDYRRSAPTHRMSALQDVEAGRPLEVHETLGYASAKSRELGLDLPLLTAFTRLLAAVDRTRRAAPAPTGN